MGPEREVYLPPQTMSDLRHIIEAQQFDRDVMSQIFRVAREMEQVVQHYGSNILNRRVMASLFYEPSTRTRLSFESAMRRLGGDVITTESALEFSSAAKGETLEDTIQIVGGYADIIVLRHFESGASRRAAGRPPACEPSDPARADHARDVRLLPAGRGHRVSGGSVRHA